MKKQVSKKYLAMASKSGGALDSHSTSSSSSNGGVSTNASGGITGGPKGQDIPKKSKWSNRSYNPGKHNYKQHFYKNAQKCSAPNYSANVDDVFIDKDEDLVDEFDGFRITKKTNLSHLLSFRYTDSSALERNYGNSYNRQSQLVWHSGKHKRQKVYDKYQFIQANCKFVVDDGFTDVLSPDHFIDWDKIVQVQLLAPNMPYCPICLEGTPTAPRITKCGHVYCFPCVLQLISLSDNKWAKCPICFDAVSEVDLRDVKCLNKKLYKIGDTITFNLMTRSRNSLKVERFIGKEIGTTEDSQMTKCGDVEMDLEKVSKYDWQQQISLIHEPALQSLNLRKQDFNEEEEDKFIALAVSKIEEVIKSLGECSSQRREAIEFEAVDCSKSQDLFRNLSRDDSEKRDGGGGGGSTAPDRYYFYQSNDGQLIYANSFNVRCLVKEYGSLECGLETVSGQIVDLSETRVDDFFRSKFRFLAHLPLSTVVTFAELDLRPPILSKQTLKHFADEMRRRKEEKDKKRKEERKRDNRINREMQRKMGGYLGHSNAVMDYDDDDEALFERNGLGEENFPSFLANEKRGGNEDPGCSDGRNERKDSSGIGLETDDFEPSSSTMDEVGSRPGVQFTSFANVLMTTCASPTYRNCNFSVWGSPTGDASVTSSSNSAWGGHKPADGLTPSLSYAQRLNLVEKNDEELRSVTKFAESEDVDIELPAPSFNESFSVAFEKALYKQGGPKSRKKKKNGNKVPLDKFNAQE